MTVVTPLRFVSGVIGLWIAGRAVVLVPGLLGGTAEADVSTPRAVEGGRPAAMASALPAALPPTILPAATGSFVAPEEMAAHARRLTRPNVGPARGGTDESLASAAIAGEPASLTPARLQLVSADPAPSPTGLVSPPEAQAGGSRWSGYAYLYRRGDGDDALASGGQLGGSQAGGRIAYRLNESGPARFSAAARVSSPLDDRRGAEAAAGLDWHPLPGRPLRVSIERRVDLRGAGRNAWSAYGAGGFWREVRPGLVVDGYAQAGIVGARRRDLFADGALRAGQAGAGRRPLAHRGCGRVGCGATTGGADRCRAACGAGAADRRHRHHAGGRVARPRRRRCRPAIGPGADPRRRFLAPGAADARAEMG